MVASCCTLSPMNSTPSVARNGARPRPAIRTAFSRPTQRAAPMPPATASATPPPAETVIAQTMEARSAAVPTERSIPPVETTRVMPRAVMAGRVTLLTRMWTRFPGVRKVGDAAAKTTTRASMTAGSTTRTARTRRPGRGLRSRRYGSGHQAGSASGRRRERPTVERSATTERISVPSMPFTQ